MTDDERRIERARDMATIAELLQVAVRGTEFGAYADFFHTAADQLRREADAIEKERRRARCPTCCAPLRGGGF